jgi:hypothetical protein
MGLENELFQAFINYCRLMVDGFRFNLYQKAAEGTIRLWFGKV